MMREIDARADPLTSSIWPLRSCPHQIRAPTRQPTRLQRTMFMSHQPGMAWAMVKSRKSANAAKKKTRVAVRKPPAKKPPAKKRTQREHDVEEWIYALDPGKIKVNDIVLISTDEWSSRLVRLGTRSDYGHAALCTRPGMLFEAVPTGVMRRSVIGTFTTRREWIKVLRPRTPLGANAQGLQVAHYAERMYGRSYSRKRAALSVTECINISDNGSV